MKTGSIFRKSALAARMRPRELDEPLQMNAPHERFCRRLLLATLVVVLAWFVLWPVERTVVRKGVLVLAGDRLPVIPTLSGTVSEVFVRNDDRVSTGQVIARLRSPEADWLRAAARSQRTQASIATRWSDDPLLDAALEAVAAELAQLSSASELVSPTEGVLSGARLTVGAQVVAGEPVAEVRMDNDGEMHVLLFVDRDVSRAVEPGSPVRIRGAKMASRWADARSARVVEAVNPAAEERSLLSWRAGVSATSGATHWLRVVLDEPWSGAHDGMRVEGAVALRDRQSLLRLPAIAAVPRIPGADVVTLER